MRLLASVDLKVNASGNAQADMESLRTSIEQTDAAARRVNRTLSETRTGSRARQGAGLEAREHRVARGTMGTRGAEGRNFAALAQGAGSGTSGFVAAYATLAANIFAVTAAFQALSKAAQTEQLRRGLELVGAQAGVSLTYTAKRLEEISGYGLSAADSMRAVAQASIAGIGTDKIERLTAVAKGASLALGRDMSDSMDRLVRGVVKLEPELLDELGIMTRIDDATEAYAKTINKPVSALTLLEKRMAFQNAVLAEGEKKFKDLAEALPTDPFAQFAAAIRNLGTNVLIPVVNALNPLVDTLAKVPALVLLFPGVMSVIGGAASKVIPSFGAATEKTANSIQLFTDRTGILKQQVTEFKKEMGSSIVSFNKIAASHGQDKLRLGGNDEEAKNRLIKDRLALIDREIRVVKNISSAQTQTLTDLRTQKKLLKEILIERQNIAAAERQSRINNIMADNAKSFQNSMDNMEMSFRRGPLSALKGLAVGIGEDFRREFNTAKKVGQASAGALSSSFGTAFRYMGALVNSFSAMFIRLGAAVNAALGWIGMVISIGTAIYSVFAFLNQEADKLKEKNKELADGLQKVREEIANLQAQGRYTQAWDAQNNALKEIIARYDEIAVKEKERLKVAAFGSRVITKLDVVVGEGKDITILDYVKKFSSSDEEAALRVNELAIATANLTELQIKNVGSRLLTIKSSKDLTAYIAELAQANVNSSTSFAVTSETMKSVQDTLTKLGSVTKTETGNLATYATNLSGLIGGFKGKDYIAIQQFVEENIATITDLSKYYGEAGAAASAAARAFVGIQQAKMTPEKGAEKVKQLQLAFQNLAAAATASETALQEGAVTAKMSKTAADEAKMKADRLTLLEREISLNKELSRVKGVAEDPVFAATMELGILKQKNEEQVQAIEAKAKAAKAAAQDTINRLQSENRGLAETTAKHKENTAAIAEQQQIQSQAEDTRAKEMGQLTEKQTVLEETLKYYDSENYKTLRNLDLKKKDLDIEQKMFDLRKGLAEQTLATNRSQVERRAALEGRDLTMQEEYALAKEEHDVALKYLKDEHRLALAKFDAEEGIRKISLQNEYNKAKTNLELARREGLSTPALEQTAREAFAAAFTFGGRSAEARGLLVATQASREAGKLEPLDPKKQIIANRAAAERGAADKFNLTQAGTFMPSQMREAFNQLMEQEASITGKTVSQILMDPSAVNRIKTASNALAQQNMQLESMVELMNGIESAMTDAFMSMIDGSKSAKEAFADMAKAILADLAQMIVRQMVYNMLQSAMGFFGFAEGGVIPMATGGVIPMAQGGIANRSSGVQGIVRQPTYLVGEGRYNEAVVPLPNGRSIPVQMHGQGASQQNNVSVNVNVASSGQATTQTEGPDMNNLGRAIAAAVQKELQAQKRPGGMLNRYGAA